MERQPEVGVSSPESHERGQTVDFLPATNNRNRHSGSGMGCCENERTDSGYSWVVAGACCLLLFGTFGVYRSSGVLYVEVIKVFGVSREDASWPFSLCGAVSSFVGIFAGALTHFFSVRQITSVGVLIGATSLVICSQAKSLLWVTICFGVLLGFGIGLINPVSQVILNQYFKKHLAAANGILLSGGSLSFFLLLPLTEKLIEWYDLRNSLLLLAGCTLQTLVAAALLKPRTITPKLYVVQTEEMKPLEPDIRSSELEIKEINFKQKCFKILVQSVDILSDRMFLVLTFSNISVTFLLLTIGVVMVDFGQDRNMERDQAVLLVSISAVPELLGRLSFGWVADRSCMTRQQLICVMQVLAGAAVLAMAAVKQAIVLFVLSAVFGLVTGSIFILVNVLYAQYMGHQKLGMALGLRYTLTGFAFLVRPNIIGFFRDRTGSYDQLFYLLGSVSILAGLMWLFEPCLNKNRRTRQSR